MTEKEVRPSSKEGTDVVSAVSKSKRKLHADKDAYGVKCDKSRIKMAKNSSKLLSDIDDAEVCRYLHTKNETQIKNILWEVMNRNVVKVHKKRQVKTNKVCPAKEVLKTDSQDESKKRLSSKINFDILEKLNLELDNNSERSNNDILDSDCGKNSDLQQDTRTFSAEACSHGESECDDEYEAASEYDEESYTNRDYIEDEEQNIFDFEDY